jgi:hypothetical protein
VERLVERARQVAHIRESLVGILVQAAQQDLIDGGGHRDDRRRRRWRTAQLIGQEIEPCGVEWTATGDHLVQDDAERVDVGAAIRAAAHQLLGRHVLERADGGAHDRQVGRLRQIAAREDLRDAEVEHLHDIVRRDEDVRGLEITVDDAEVVCLAQGRAHLGPDREHALPGQGAARAKQVEQRPALEQLHRDERQPIGFAELVGRDDVRAEQLAQHDALAPEPLDEARISGELAMHDLERDALAAHDLRAAIDRTERADRDPLLDLVAPADQLAEEWIGDRRTAVRTERRARVERGSAGRALHAGTTLGKGVASASV